MKKASFLFVSVTFAIVLSALIGIYFMIDIFNFMKLIRENLSSMIIDPEVQILLYLSLIGLIGFFGSRSYKK